MARGLWQEEEVQQHLSTEHHGEVDNRYQTVTVRTSSPVFRVLRFEAASAIS